MDQRTRHMLIDQGVITQRGLTRTARHRHCPSCGLVLLAAQDMGREIWCDPFPITIHAELQALLNGRATFCSPTGGLNYRNFTRITFRNANQEPVYAEHACGKPPLEINPRHIKPPREKQSSDEIPF